jgi:hypothetical protein
MKEPNGTTGKDIAHSLAKGALGAIPVIGSLAAEVFGLIVTPPLDKRRAEWMNEVAEKLKELEDRKKIDFVELQNNEQFIDVVLQATTYALKTSEKEKIIAFQNAIINTAVGDTPDKTISQIFLNQLDSFTVWHIKVLKFIDNPRLWFQEANRIVPSATSLSNILFEVYPELKDQEEIFNLIWNDLKTAGFHATGDPSTIMSGDGALSRRTTSLGKKFLDYISNYNE